MYMHENSFDFTDQANQDIAVFHFILEKHEIVHEEINQAASKNLQTAVHILPPHPSQAPASSRLSSIVEGAGV